MFEEFEDFEGNGASATTSDGLVVDADRLADVRRMMAGEGATPTKVTPAMLDGLTHQELRALREVIDRKLPDNSLDELNLEKELVSQYMLVKRLQDAVITDEEIPLNQRAQLANSVVATLGQLVKLQEDLKREESLKLMETCLLDSLLMLPEDVREQFFVDYEKMAASAGLK